MKSSRQSHCPTRWILVLVVSGVVSVWHCHPTGHPGRSRGSYGSAHPGPGGTPIRPAPRHQQRRRRAGLSQAFKQEQQSWETQQTNLGKAGDSVSKIQE